MTTGGRRALYKLLRSLGAPGDFSQNPVPIGDSEKERLVDSVPWVNWVVTIASATSKGTRVATMKAEVDDQLPALHAEGGLLYSKWMLVPAAVIVGLGALLVGSGFGIFILVILVLAALGGIVQFGSTVSGAITLVVIFVIIVGSFALDLRRNRLLRTVRFVSSWLSRARAYSEAVPQEWGEVLDDPEFHALVVEWMLSRREVDDLEAHISRGVELRKHLSPVDSRRRTMQAEIETQRWKRDELVFLRRERAQHITETAESLIGQREQVYRERQRRIAKIREEERNRLKTVRELRAIEESEQARIKAQEQVDRWLDGGQ